LILIPFLISIIVVSYLSYAFLSTDNGFINNSIIKAAGGEPVNWYAEPAYWPFILTLVFLWKSFGYNSIIYYATVVGIDQSYYEAAAIDGATRWERVKYITFPGLKSTIITLTLLAVGRIFYSDFGLFYLIPMNSGPLFDVTNTIDTYVYRGLMQMNNIGMSSAAGLYQSIVGFILVLTANSIVTKLSKDDALF
jgi:putative aldouronate transport system permease protein